MTMGYASATWRLILDGQADGATNMAVDEAILTAVLEGSSPPTLRFYGWSPPCLSLGRNQPLADVDRAACIRAGVDVVRRPTGGRAILHTDELTYSLALLQSDPRATGDVVESYRRLSEGLLVGLRLLGADARRAGAAKHGLAPSAICFETPSDYEIIVAGRKLVGSAQWRTQGGLLQHGSLPLHGDPARIVDCLALTPEERETERARVHRRAMTLEEALGRTVSFTEAAQALSAGFAQALHLILTPAPLTERERALVAEIRRRYASPEWTARR